MPNMPARPLPRPGGRSARVQAAVHQAARELIAEAGRDALTVPAIAARAGVTPSTIYRRWGDLPELLADLAVGRLRADTPPVDTGSLAGDLLAWAEQFMEEMSSAVGLAMMRDVVAGGNRSDATSACGALVAAQVDIIRERAVARGEPVPPVAAVMDGVVAPVIYRALFGPVQLNEAQLRALVGAALDAAAAEGG